MGRFIAQPCRVVGRHLTTTTNTAVHAAQGFTQVIGVRLANITGSDATATVSYYSIKDNDQYRILYQHTVPANGAIWVPLEAFGLRENDEIRVQAGTANAIDVLVSIAETPGRSG